MLVEQRRRGPVTAAEPPPYEGHGRKSSPSSDFSPEFMFLMLPSVLSFGSAPRCPAGRCAPLFPLCLPRFPLCNLCSGVLALLCRVPSWLGCLAVGWCLRNLLWVFDVSPRSASSSAVLCSPSPVFDPPPFGVAPVQDLLLLALSRCSSLSRPRSVPTVVRSVNAWVDRMCRLCKMLSANLNWC